MIKALIAYRRQRQTVRELSRLSDRELADIGIVRADIASIARLADESIPTSERRTVAPRSVPRHRPASASLSGLPTGA